MRYILIAICLMFLVPALASAHSLAWDRNNVEPDFAGYNAYDTTSGRVKLNATLLSPSSICTGIPPAGSCVFPIPIANHVTNHTFVVTAVDTNGNESADSNIATLDLLPPASPGSLHIINQ